MTYDYDFLVIGGGSGGVRAARIAAGHGANAAIIEGDKMGGTCVNVGCVPKKLFAYAADFSMAYEDGVGYGWESVKPKFDWPTLVAQKNKEIERLNAIYQMLMDKAAVPIIKGWAKFVDNHTVEVDGRQISAETILIATGGRPRRLEYEGAELTLLSDDMFFLEELPKRVVIEGGGYIAVEFAHIFEGLGCEITMINRSKGVLTAFDQDICQALQDEMHKQHITLHLGTTIQKIVEKGKNKIVTTRDGHEIECDMILSAVGRVPNTERLGLENTGVEMDDGGYIKVTDDYRTSEPCIFAIGDVTRTPPLTPIAIKEGHYLADSLFSDKDCQCPEYGLIPTAVFSNPPVGTVGLTESQAREDGYDIDIYRTRFRPLKHALSGRDEKTMMKLVVDKKTDKVLGVHMVGADTPEMLQGFGVALNAGATKADFDRTIPIHPTSAEELVTMREPAKTE